MASSTKNPSSGKTARAKPGPLVLQFSVFLENKCGRLLVLTRLFEKTQIHVLGLSVVDTTDSAVVRLIMDDPDKTAELFRTHNISFGVTEVLVAELPHGPEALVSILIALLQAEINIYYVYSLLVRSRERPVLVLHVEDNELAHEVLGRQGFATLGQVDLSR